MRDGSVARVVRLQVESSLHGPLLDALGASWRLAAADEAADLLLLGSGGAPSPGTPTVLVVPPEAETEALRTALRAGHRGVLTWPRPEPGGVEHEIDAMLASAAEAPPLEGLWLWAGLGATLDVATALAVTAASARNADTVLLDMDPAFDDFAPWVPDGPCIGDLGRRHLAPRDLAELPNLGSGGRVLRAGRVPDDAQFAESAMRAWRALGVAGRVVVLRASLGLGPASLATVGRATSRFIVVGDDGSGVHRARVCLERVTGTGVPPHEVRVVLQATGARLARAERVSAAIGAPVAAVLPLPTRSTWADLAACRPPRRADPWLAAWAQLLRIPVRRSPRRA